MSDNDGTLVTGKHIPEGLDFLQMIWEQEDDCERETDQELPKMGEKASQCLLRLGTVLSLLDRLSTCWWGCRGGDHLIEYLVGRSVNCARASLRLSRFGFYDEALSVTRSIGEIANLMCLFTNEVGAFDRWRTADASVRKTTFGPMQVRMQLENLRAIASK